LLTLAVSISGLMLNASRVAARPLPASRTLLTGAASSVAEFPSWNHAFGGRLKLRMVFQAWAFAPNPATVLEGPGIPVISWEPWKPTQTGTSAKQQGVAQPVYSNRAIADGKWDTYLTAWAQAIKAHGGPVILRPMAEFNGFWYPWSHDPKEYVRAWRHMWNLFHSIGATNVTWVWSFQPGENPKAWRKQVEQYWPGDRYVDVVGMTLVRFANGHDVPHYTDYLALAHRLFKRPTMITEANVAYSVRLPWLSTLHLALAQIPYNQAFIWSQAPSQEQARNPAAGDMNWDARTDHAATASLAAIAALPR
jgi:hypothetical protein